MAVLKLFLLLHSVLFTSHCSQHHKEQHLSRNLISKQIHLYVDMQDFSSSNSEQFFRRCTYVSSLQQSFLCLVSSFPSPPGKDSFEIWNKLIMTENVLIISRLKENSGRVVYRGKEVGKFCFWLVVSVASSVWLVSKIKYPPHAASFFLS